MAGIVCVVVKHSFSAVGREKGFLEMICGSSGYQGKKRIRDLERIGVFCDKQARPHGRWVRVGDGPDWVGEFVPTKRKAVK